MMGDPVRVRTGDVRWEVLPECREQLLGPDGLRLADWLRDGQAQVVKHGPHRTVYQVHLPGLHFFLKHYRLPNARAWLRQLVRPSKARMEYRQALAVAGRDVPTVEPLALGERGAALRPDESFLVTRCLEDTEPLSVFIEATFPGLEPGRRARVRQRLAGALGRLIARMHDAGLTHNDLHAANLLVRLGGDDRPRLFIIDLHDVRLGAALDWGASRANLVMLNRWFVQRVGRADRLRFLHAYCRARKAVRWGEAGCQPPGRRALLLLARDLERATRESNWRFWRGRDRRSLATNRYYRRVRSALAVGHAVVNLDPVCLNALLDDPDEPFRRPGITVLKDSPSSTVVEVDVTVGGRTCRAIYKRFRVTAWSDPWVALLRPPAALRSWVYGHGLRERGLPTPRPLAMFHRRRYGLSYEGYLLTEKIPAARDLHAVLADLNRLPAAERRAGLRRLIDQAARLVRELHRRRLSHRDLKAANLLVSEGSAGEESAPPPLPVAHPLSPHLWLIDLVGVTCRRRLSRRRRVQNLARLNASFYQDPAVTRTDRLRFLRVYLQWGLLGRSGWKRWWRETAEATRRKADRNRRRNRPLA